MPFLTRFSGPRRLLKNDDSGRGKERQGRFAGGVFILMYCYYQGKQREIRSPIKSEVKTCKRYHLKTQLYCTIQDYPYNKCTKITDGKYSEEWVDRTSIFAHLLFINSHLYKRGANPGQTRLECDQGRKKGTSRKDPKEENTRTIQITEKSREGRRGREIKGMRIVDW